MSRGEAVNVSDSRIPPAFAKQTTCTSLNFSLQSTAYRTKSTTMFTTIEGDDATAFDIGAFQRLGPQAYVESVLEGLPTQRRFEVCQHWLASLDRAEDLVGALSEAFYEKMEMDCTDVGYQSIEDFRLKFDDDRAIRRRIETYRKKRNRKEPAIRRIKDVWGDSLQFLYCPIDLYGRDRLEAVARFAEATRGLAPGLRAGILNAALVERLNKTGQTSSRREISINASDLKSAISTAKLLSSSISTDALTLPAMSRVDRQKYGLAISEGLLVPRGSILLSGARCIESDDHDQGQDEELGGGMRHYTSDGNIQQIERATSVVPPSLPPNDVTEEEALNNPNTRRKRGSSDAMEVDKSVAEEDEDEGEDVQGEECEEGEECDVMQEGDSNCSGTGVILDRKSNRQAHRHVSSTGVMDAEADYEDSDRIDDWDENSDEEEMDMPAPKRTRAKYAAPTTRRFMGLDRGLCALKSAYRATNKTFIGFCFIHFRLLMSTTTGMRNSYDGAGLDSMRSRLKTYLQYRSQIPRLRKKKYDWFYAELQNNPTRSQLGGMKYAPKLNPTINIDSQMVYQRFASQEVWQEFLDNGSVNIGGIFSYILDDEQYSQWINLEFAMYKHHFHAKGNQGKRLGWLRNMWYSLIQQVVRQDPVYYALVAASRPDKNWRLISYPYYTKYTSDGENTGFSHLDLNIKNFVESGKGANIVQGGLALTNETIKNCTTLVLGFHKHAHEWYADLKARGEGDITGSTTDCKNLYSLADRQTYGDLVPIPCRRGDVRITLPEIVHGTTPQADGERRIVLPWFTGIQADNLELLDNKESETWSEVAACHRDMVPCLKSPSGRSAKAYQKGPPFRAVVLLASTSPIGDALLGRQRWDNAQVLSQVKILFGQNDDASKQLVTELRKNVKGAYERAWKQLVASEKEVYGEKSFFWLQEHKLAAPNADGSDESELSSVEGEVILTSDEEVV
ncbi:hypothetical protein K440DRAFT_660435 [Wilcoxina mikolae CBS 423.85]|nr:hypothetical protein K440DRAFT_660435 [Wilcoxina mikolae CBS 423.85]